ncbi:histidine phosphatase family protein [Christensenellaceae bacterium OttesenSCG-928-L17]|nr:histidine phosphatase family protein [Christensenellaceae bacterium OttesenSCG-928-L17]
MKVIFIRHGESQANKDGVIAGSRLDSPLTKKGISDAKLTASNLQSLRHEINYVISSPLIRALDTARIIIAELVLDTEIEIMSEFAERDAGSATGAKKGDRTFALMDMADKANEAETSREMYDRLKRGVDKLKKLNGTVLVASHNGAIKAVRAVLAGLPPDEFKNMPDLPNGEMFVWENTKDS